LQTVLDTLVESAARLCEADEGTIFQPRDGVYHLAANCGLSPVKKEFLANHRFAPGKESTVGRVLLEGKTIHVHDIQADPNYFGQSDDPHPIHTMLGVPLLREGAPIGVFVLTRRETQPFSEKQIELVQTFADQAVIAIENVRLFDEVQARTEDLRESLEFQTATSDVLKVISSSPDSLQPVLDVIVDTARHLCGTETSTIFLLKEGRFHIAAASGAIPEYLEFLRKNPIALDQAGSSTSRAAREKHTVHIPDIAADPEFGQGPMGVGQRRALLSVPLMREGTAIGVITMRQSHLTPFTERQIEVVQTFADQAVIAISNVRLFEEVQARTRDLSESLQQQTATADVLKVISRSAFDLQAVLDTLISSAVELSGAFGGTICLREGDGYRYLATSGMEDGFKRFLLGHPPTPGLASAAGRVLLSAKVESIPDVLEDPDYLLPVYELNKTRSVVGVPLLRNDNVEGALVLNRTEPGLFTARQIELVQTFADQAVIAIENARLFDEVQAKTRELTEALTYQTGSSNILSVIASSPTDVAPVLKAIVESACELCEADDALVVLKDGDHLVFKAQHGSIPVVWHRQPVNRQWAAGRAVVDRMPIHVHDLLAPEGEGFPDAREFARRTNVRTVLSVPLLRENESIGSIVLRRTDVQPFSDKQIALQCPSVRTGAGAHPGTVEVARRLAHRAGSAGADGKTRLPRPAHRRHRP
jgi:GAF domain-containing protein